MSFVGTLRRARSLLRAEGRMSLRVLRREFDLDDAALEDLVRELVEVQGVAAREGDLLAWVEPPASHAAPRDYTPPHVAEEILSSRAAREGERKQVTVLFVDVQGSVALSERLGPETWHGVLDRFFRIASEAVHRFGGTVNQYTGDGIMALFGAPLAEEDHAACGCAAALALRDAVRGFAAELRRDPGIEFAVRMGLNSGEVVVGKIGDDLRMDYTAQGHTVGLAHRMQVLAEPGQVLLTEHTADLAAGFLELRDLGPVDVRGREHAVRAFAAERLRSSVSRFEAARRRGMSRFVGREREIARLEAAAERARRGQEVVVGIVAEPGIGKSRLCHEFLARCEAGGIPIVRASCPPHARDAPLTAIATGLRSYFGLRDEDGEAAVRARVERRLREDGTPPGEVGFLLDFLGVSGDPAFSSMDPAGREARLVEVLVGIQARRPKSELWVFLYEDLHWIDAASERVLDAIFRRTGATSALRVQTFRPEYGPPWSGLPGYECIALDALPDAHAEALLGELLGSGPGMRPLAARIRERTGGNALFIEETVRELRESGSLAGPAGAHRLEGPLQDLSTPVRVQSVIHARIDRLAPEPRWILQAASAIGLAFDLSLLACVSARSEAEVGAHLGTLTAGHFLAPDDTEGRHRFVHPLVQEVAYGVQLRPARRKLHRAIAEELERRLGERRDERAALVAMHWEEADEPLRAARRHHDACLWLAARNPVSAAAHARRVRELAAGLDGSGEATALAVSGCNELLRHGWHTGLDFAQVQETFDRGFPLAEQLGDREAQVRMLLGYGRRAKHMGEIAPWHDSVERAVALGAGGLSPGLAVNLAGERVHVLLLAARLDEALTIAEDVAARIRREPAILQDPDAGEGLPQALWLRVDALWALGRSDEALAGVRDLVTLARRFPAPTLQVLSLAGNAKIAALCGLADEAMQRASEARHAATDLGAILYLVSTHHRLGSALLVREDFPEAVRELTASLRLARDHRIYADNEVHVLSDLALARLGCGESAEARETAEEAVALAGKRQAVFHGCFAGLARARVKAAEDDIAGAREDLLGVIEVAGRTGARSFDRRARSELEALIRREGAA